MRAYVNKSAPFTLMLCAPLTLAIYAPYADIRAITPRSIATPALFSRWPAIKLFIRSIHLPKDGVADGAAIPPDGAFLSLATTTVLFVARYIKSDEDENIEFPRAMRLLFSAAALRCLRAAPLPHMFALRARVAATDIQRYRRAMLIRCR